MRCRSGRGGPGAARPNTTRQRRCKLVRSAEASRDTSASILPDDACDRVTTVECRAMLRSPHLGPCRAPAGAGLLRGLVRFGGSNPIDAPAIIGWHALDRESAPP